jgi:hypothetical protein
VNALALVAVPGQAMKEFDNSHGGADVAFGSKSLVALAFCGTPESIEKFLSEKCPKIGVAREKCINAASHIVYHNRLLGIKKTGERYTIGLGCKATPLQFACVAGKMDNVLYLLQCGAEDVVAPKLAAICAANQMEGIAEVLKAHQIQVAQEAKKKRQRRYRNRSRSGSRPRTADSARPTTSRSMAISDPA